jgi:hypothetical protein
MSEISILQKRDKAPGAGHMEFIDIADDNFDPTAHSGVAYKSAMSTMYGGLWGARLAPSCTSAPPLPRSIGAW